MCIGCICIGTGFTDLVCIDSFFVFVFPLIHKATQPGTSKLDSAASRGHCSRKQPEIVEENKSERVCV